MRVSLPVEGLDDVGGGEGEDEGEEEDEGAEVLLPDQKRRGCAGRWLQVEEIRAEGCQEQSPSQELLQVHAQQLPREEARGAAVDGLPHGDHHVRGPPHAPPLRRQLLLLRRQHHHLLLITCP
uniref:Uncharacterized protein n=1 Tax=Aegilops tauschii subsp. strangulata TaxID=200361 RepID=A0A453P750_AEGTS